MVIVGGISRLRWVIWSPALAVLDWADFHLRRGTGARLPQTRSMSVEIDPYTTFSGQISLSRSGPSANLTVPFGRAGRRLSGLKSGAGIVDAHLESAAYQITSLDLAHGTRNPV